MAMELLFNRTAFIFEHMIEKPLIYTYLHGGTLFGIGGHGGRPETEICSLLTNVPSKHWEQNPDQCEALINTKIRSVEVLCGFMAYMTLIGLIVWRGSTRAMSAVESVGSMLLAKTGKGLSFAGGVTYEFCVSAWKHLVGEEEEDEETQKPNAPPSVEQKKEPETIVLGDD